MKPTSSTDVVANNPHPVADLSVMLALMAGRNAGETLTLVKGGQECTAIAYLLAHLSYCFHFAVALFQLGSICLLWPTAKHNSRLASPHNRLPRLRPHLPSNPRPSNPIWCHSLSLLLRPLLSAKHIKGRSTSETTQPNFPQTCRYRRTCPGE